MTTSSAYVYWNHIATATDSDIRNMMAAFYTRLESIGWTKSSDTGQVDRTTVTNAQINSNSATTAYQIHYFDDALHGVAPFYLKTRWLKVGYSNSYLYVNYELGSGTNGSGTLTGATYRISDASSIAFVGTAGYVRIDTTYREDKYSGLLIGSNTTDNTLAPIYGGSSFFFGRSVDVVTEQPNTDGAFFYSSLVGASAPYARLHYYNGTSWNVTDNYSYVPGNKTYSPPEGFAAYRHWFVAQNKYQLIPYMITVMHNEIGLDQEVTVTPGSLPHKYRKLGITWPCSTYQGATAVTTRHRPAIIWE